MESKLQKPVIIYAESTPNPASMKFVANRFLVPEGATVQFLKGSDTKGSPLARALFQFPFVKDLFISGNYITVTKSESVTWDDITLEVREFMKEFLTNNPEAVTEVPTAEVHTDNTFQTSTTIFTEHTPPQNETEHKIVEILEQYIRPAVEQDGGLITFRSFHEGIVTVQLKGACSGCPSSTMTLKAGIEGLLKRLVPGVNEVVAEAV
ncbi:MAG: NifU family protein [Bacteroidia bacterium]